MTNEAQKNRRFCPLINAHTSNRYISLLPHSERELLRIFVDTRLVSEKTQDKSLLPISLLLPQLLIYLLVREEEFEVLKLAACIRDLIGVAVEALTVLVLAPGLVVG